MPESPRRRQEDTEIPVDAALVHVLDSRREAEHQREWERAEMKKDRRRWLFAYLVVVVAGAFLFWRVEHQQFVQCQNDNEQTATIRTFLADAYMADREGISEGERRILNLADENFAEVECPPEPWRFWP